MFDNVLTKSNYTILYAEDEPEVRKVYEYFLQNYFKKVVIAENGTEAWDKFQETKPDVVILDILMPGLNGVEVAKKIREINKEVILVIMTANDTKEWLYSSIELGLTKFIKKGTKLFTEMESIILDIIKSLDDKYNPENDLDNWYITPEGVSPKMVWNISSHKLYKDGEVVKLSQKLTQLINYFAHNRDRIISHEEIARELWESEDVEDKKTSTEQKIRAFLYTIKNKIGVDIFRSHYKQGYTIELVQEDKEEDK